MKLKKMAVTFETRKEALKELKKQLALANNLEIDMDEVKNNKQKHKKAFNDYRKVMENIVKISQLLLYGDLP